MIGLAELREFRSWRPTTLLHPRRQGHHAQVAAPTEFHRCMPADSIGLDGASRHRSSYDTGPAWSAGDKMERALLDVMTCIRLGTTLEERARVVGQ